MTKVSENETAKLFRAIKEKNLQIAQESLKSIRSAINENNHVGLTPLMLACKLGCNEIVQEILKSEYVKVNQKNKYGWTSLIWAAKEGHYEIVEMLLNNQNIKINLNNKHGDTALTWAKENKDQKMICLLEEHGALGIEFTIPVSMAIVPVNKSATQAHAAASSWLNFLMSAIGLGAITNKTDYITSYMPNRDSFVNSISLVTSYLPSSLSFAKPGSKIVPVGLSHLKAEERTIQK